jgi:hypothetical protein
MPLTPEEVGVAEAEERRWSGDEFWGDPSTGLT